MSEVLILKGLPASGKSTYAKQRVDREQFTKRINKDDIRAMLDNGHWSKTNEKFVLLVRNQLIGLALSEGYDVIVDDTNLHPKHEAEIRELVANVPGVSVSTKFFEVDVEEAIKRDLKRPVSVGEKVIRKMYDDFLAPTPPVIARDNSLPDCILVDLDGTLALINDRSPYDGSKCEQDFLNMPVYSVLNLIQERNKHTFGPYTRIIFMSGRNSKYRLQTSRWLEGHGFSLDHDESSVLAHRPRLYMRGEDDMRKDSIVKQELYETHIKDKYNTLYVIDDRQQVVDMWRSLGLTVFQVAKGDF